MKKVCLLVCNETTKELIEQEVILRQDSKGESLATYVGYVICDMGWDHDVIRWWVEY